MHLSFLTLFIPLTAACVTYYGVAPFDDDSPFEAILTDNGVTTCWISLSYNAHRELQTQYSLSHARHFALQIKGKPSTSKPSLTIPSPNPRLQSSIGSKKVTPEMQGRYKMDVPTYAEADDWIAWGFECLEGYNLRARVGLRGLTYRVRGKDFNLQPGMREDIWGEKWVSEGEWWCKPKAGDVKEGVKGTAGAKEKEKEKEKEVGKEVVVSKGAEAVNEGAARKGEAPKVKGSEAGKSTGGTASEGKL